VDFHPRARPAAIRSAICRLAGQTCLTAALLLPLFACGADAPGPPRWTARLDGESVRVACQPAAKPRWQLHEAPGGGHATGLRQASGSVCRLSIEVPPGARLSLTVRAAEALRPRANEAHVAIAVAREGGDARLVFEREVAAAAAVVVDDLELTPGQRGASAIELRHTGPPDAPDVVWLDARLGAELDTTSPAPEGWRMSFRDALRPFTEQLAWPARAPGGRRLLVVGVDGASWPLVDELIAEGVVPNLAALSERGLRGRLESSFVPESAMAWTTLRTGVTAGEHGVLHFMSPDHTRRSYWSWLDDAGLRGVVIGVPKSSPEEPWSGVLVGGWNMSTEQRYTRPAVLAEHLAKAGYRPGIANVADTTRYAERMRDRTDLALALLDDLDWDHAFVVYEYTDTAGHRFGLHTDGWREAYALLDHELGRLLAGLPADVTLLVVSDHGWKRFRRAFSPRAWLRANGFAHWLTHIYGGHRVALRPAEPLDAAAETRAIGELRAALAELRDPATGEPVVARVLRFSEALPGPFGEQSMLRAFVELEPGYHAAAKAQGDEVWPDIVPEHHDVGGLYLLVGPGIAPGRGPDARIEDVAPTVSGFFGVEPPADVRGTAIGGLAAPAPRTREPAAGVRASAGAGAGAAARPSDALRESLRALGYIDEGE